MGAAVACTTPRPDDVGCHEPESTHAGSRPTSPAGTDVACGGEEEHTETGLVIRSPRSQSKMERLMAAVKEGNSDEVDALLGGADAAVSVDCRGMWSNTPLLLAQQYGHAALARRLLTRWCADPSLANEKQATPLLHACAEGDLGMVHALLERQAPVEPKTPGLLLNPVVDRTQSLTPLVAASMNGHAEVVRALLDRGADVDRAVVVDSSSRAHPTTTAAAPACNALYCAIAFVQPSVMELLLSRGAKWTTSAAAYESPFIAACCGKSRPTTLQLDQDLADLIRRYPEPARTHDLAMEDQKGGGTALHVACQRRLVHTALCMIDVGVDIHRTDGCQSTPLHHASQRGLAPVVKRLLERGADPSSTDTRGRTALVLASRARHGDAVAALLTAATAGPTAGVQDNAAGSPGSADDGAACPLVVLQAGGTSPQAPAEATPAGFGASVVAPKLEGVQASGAPEQTAGCTGGARSPGPDGGPSSTDGIPKGNLPTTCADQQANELRAAAPTAPRA